MQYRIKQSILVTDPLGASEGHMATIELVEKHVTDNIWHETVLVRVWNADTRRESVVEVGSLAGAETKARELLSKLSLFDSIEIEIEEVS